MKIAIASALALLAFAACKKDPLYCDANTPCTDPARPFCDHDGEYPASEGIKHTCIPDPFPDAGPGDLDGGAGRTVAELATSGNTSCAVLSDGALRCWGDALLGGERIGDNEHPREAGDIETGGPIAQAAVGDGYICVRYRSGGVRCWGANDDGQLGYGHTDPITSPPAELPDVQIGGPAIDISAGSGHTCAVLEGGDLRCWGNNAGGQLGYGHTENIGDSEVPTDEPDPVDMGGAVRAVSCGSGYSCAVLEAGGVRCWGVNYMGRLGYAHTENIGDTETPAEGGFVNVGGGAESVSVHGNQTCVLLTGGAVRCWGTPSGLGIPGLDEPIGDDEAPASVDPIELGGDARQVVGGQGFHCVRMANDDAMCWGGGTLGNLGYGSEEDIGDNEPPAEAGPIMLGGKVQSLSVGGNQRNHSCAILSSGAVRCWGHNDLGQLGLGYMIDAVGDDETPVSVDPVQILD